MSQNSLESGEKVTFTLDFAAATWSALIPPYKPKKKSPARISPLFKIFFDQNLN